MHLSTDGLAQAVRAAYEPCGSDGAGAACDELAG